MKAEPSQTRKLGERKQGEESREKINMRNGFNVFEFIHPWA